MSVLTIDLNDDHKTLLACRNLLNHMLGGAPFVDTRDAVEPDDHAASATTSSDGRIDDRGVPFDGNYCGDYSKPFYTSGKRSGQWKKKVGVSDEEYDAWYAGQVAVGRLEPEPEPEQVDTSAAFGAQTQQQPQSEPIPEEAGQFFGWISAQQAAGNVSSDDIGHAYVVCELDTMDLFPPKDPETVKQNCRKLYDYLNQLMGSRQ